MINIHGLTREQCDMLDILWSFKSKDEYFDWMENLDEEEAIMAQGLMELLLLAILEENQEEADEPYREAKMVIQNIKSKFDTK